MGLCPVIQVKWSSDFKFCIVLMVISDVNDVILTFVGHCQRHLMPFWWQPCWKVNYQTFTNIEQCPVSRRFIVLLLVLLVVLLHTEILQPSLMICRTSSKALHCAIRAVTYVLLRLFCTLNHSLWQANLRGPFHDNPIDIGAHLSLKKSGSVDTIKPEIEPLIARCFETKNWVWSLDCWTARAERKNCKGLLQQN